MPIPYENLTYNDILHHQAAYECFDNVGKKMFEDKNIPVEYAEIIPLVISSQDATKVCPIEKFLSEHDDPTEQWDFLEEKYTGDNAPTCCAAK